MSLYTVHFSTIIKRSIYNAGVFVSETIEFKKQVITGLPLRTAMQYDKCADFQLVPEVPTSDRRGKPPRTPSQVNWNGTGGEFRPRAKVAKVAKTDRVDKKLDAARTGDLGAALEAA